MTDRERALVGLGFIKKLYGADRVAMKLPPSRRDDRGAARAHYEAAARLFGALDNRHLAHSLQERLERFVSQDRTVDVAAPAKPLRMLTTVTVAFTDGSGPDGGFARR